MNHHFISNRRQLRRVCVFHCGTRSWTFAWNRRFHPLSFNKQRWHSQGLAKPECVLLPPCAPRRSYLSWRIHVIYCVTHGHAHTHSRVTPCLLCSTALFVPAESCLQGTLYQKCGVLFPSQWIHLHSFHCLSLLRAHSNYQQLRSPTTVHILSPSVTGGRKKRAAAGAFLLLWYYSFSSLRGCSSYWFVCCQARLLSSILLSESEEKQWPDLCANTAPPYRVLVVIGLGRREMRHVLI